jgi:adenylate cyclase
VRRTEDKVRITAQLIDAQNSRHLWAKKYDRELKDIFVLKDEITKKITTALQVKLTEGEGEQDWETHSFEAYIKLKQAVEYYRRFTPDDNILSRQKAKEALALDPNYIPAMNMLAWTILTDVTFGTSNSIEKSIERAFELAQHAFKIGGERADTYFLIGFIHRMKGQFEKAVDELEKAHALCLNCADISAGLGMALNDAGRPEEAMQILKNALRLNPIPPSWYYYQIGNAYRMTGKYEKALREYKKAIQVQPDNFLAHLGLAVAYVYLGREKEARATAAEVLRINPKFSVELYAKSIPASNETAWQREMDALRKAGLPE